MIFLETIQRTARIYSQRQRAHNEPVHNDNVPREPVHNDNVPRERVRNDNVTARD